MPQLYTKKEGYQYKPRCRPLVFLLINGMLLLLGFREGHALVPENQQLVDLWCKDNIHSGSHTHPSTEPWHCKEGCSNGFWCFDVLGKFFSKVSSSSLAKIAVRQLFAFCFPNQGRAKSPENIFRDSFIQEARYVLLYQFFLRCIFIQDVTRDSKKFTKTEAAENARTVVLGVKLLDKYHTIRNIIRAGKQNSQITVLGLSEFCVGHLVKYCVSGRIL